MSNFYFLEQEKEYSLFSSAAIEANGSIPLPLPCVPLAAARRWSWQSSGFILLTALCPCPIGITCNPSFTSLPSVSRWTSKPGKTALYRQARQHGSPYRKAYFRR